jgi:beta-lactam-binding protein with PASTA domain
MRICPSCKSENADDADFCQECNTYLRWEPTVLAPSVPRREAEEAPPPSSSPPDEPAGGAPAKSPAFVAQRLPVIKEGAQATADTPVEEAEPPPPAPTKTKAMPTAPETVTITLRLPGDEGAGATAVTTGVDPGGQAVIRALVRNQSGIVDNYDLSIEGFPAEWWTITPATVYLVPFGAPGGDYEQEVEIRLHPPRAPEAESRLWPLTVVASSKAQEARVGSATISATIAPYQELETEVRPERAGGRRRAKFAVAARNRANAPVEVLFSAVDSENACKFDFAESTVTAASGRRAGTAFRARPNKQIWLGRPADRRFQVLAAVPGSDAPQMPRQAVFRQKPWIAWWVPLAIPLLAAAAVAVYLLLPHNTTVPSLKGLKLFDARARLEAKGLALGATDNGDVAKDASLVGKVERQSPPPGKKVKKGTAVSVAVWIGSGKVKVPDLKGKSLNEAKAALDPLKLQVGKTTPEPADPDKVKVLSQSPAAGTSVAEGGAVDLFFPAVKKGGGTGKSGPGGKKPLKGAIKVPALTGLVGASAGALAALGLTAQRTPAISAKPLNTIVGQSPAAGTPVQKGTPITVLYSIGMPQIAYDTGHAVLVMSGLNGKVLHRLGTGIEPSWKPGGKQLVYRDASKRIVTVDPSVGAPSLRALTSGHDDRRPVFSPDGKTVAFIRTSTGADMDLCFVRAIGGNLSCIPDPNLTVDRPSWSPDGKAIITVAWQTSNPSHAFPFLYHAARASSPVASSWVGQQLAFPGDVLFAAFSPDARKPRVAVIANSPQSPSAYSLFFVPWSSATGFGKPVPTNIGACSVNWRPDGKEVAIEQTSDCSALPNPKVVRIDADNPSHTTPLPPVPAYNPAWQLVDLTPR